MMPALSSAHAAARLGGRKVTVAEFTSYHVGPEGLLVADFLRDSGMSSLWS